MIDIIYDCCIFCDIKIMVKVVKEMDFINILKKYFIYCIYCIYNRCIKKKKNCLYLNNVGKLFVDVINLLRYEFWWKILEGDLKDFF